MTTYVEPKPVEKTAGEMAEEHRQWAQSQPTVGTCMFCPDYRVQGTCSEVKELNAAHRAELHPERKTGSRRRRGTRSGVMSYSQSLTDEDVEAIETARARRLRLLGIAAK